MGSLIKKILFLIFYFLLINNVYGKQGLNECESRTFFLNIFSKKDFLFDSKTCFGEDGYIINFLENKSTRIILNKKFNEFGYDNLILEGVSIYKKEKRPPLLITLHSEYICCYPKPEGKSYLIDIYQITKRGNGFFVKPFTESLGIERYGFDGKNNVRQRSIFKYKNIASIKRWLDKHY